MEIHDPNPLDAEPRNGRANVVERYRTDVAQVLRDDDVGAHVSQAFELDLVDRERILEHRPHVCVDRAARSHGAQTGAREHREGAYAGRKIALV